ncbi:MAG: LTA synthase family protein [Acidobacteriota bacterium]
MGIIYLIALLVKFLIFSLEFQKRFPLGVLLEGIAIILLIIVFARFLFKRNLSILIFIVTINVILSILMIANLVYFRVYHNLISFNVFKMAFMAFEKETIGGAIKLLAKKDLFFAMDIFFFPIIYLFYKYLPVLKKIDFVFFIKKYSLVAILIIILISSGLIYFNWSKVHTGGLLIILDRGGTTTLPSFYFSEVVNHIAKYLKEYKMRKEAETVSYPSWIHESFNSNKKRWNDGKESFKLKKPNFIVVQLESIGNFVIGKNFNGREITPNINKIISEGIYFPYFFSHTGAGGTSDAEISSLCSIYPKDDMAIIFAYENNNWCSMLHELKRYGYTSVAMHANNKSFWNRGYVFPKLGFDKFYGKEDFSEKGWVVDDKVLLKKSLEFIFSLPEPYLAYIITITSHSSMTAEIIYDEVNDWISEKDDDYFHQYLRLVSFVDSALGEFIRELSDKKLFDNTVLIVYGDHNWRLLHTIKDEFDKKSIRWDLPSSFDVIIKDNVPLIIYSPKNFSHRVIEKICGHIDIAPTIMAMVDSSSSSLKFLGRNLFDLSDGGWFINRKGWTSYLLLENIACFWNENGGSIQCFDNKTGKATNAEINLERFKQIIQFSDSTLILNKMK